MKFDKHIVSEKLEFYNQLQSMFDQIDIENIAIASANIERTIEHQIQTAILRQIDRIILNNRTSVVGKSFKIDGRIYEVVYAQDLHNQSDIVFSFLERSVEPISQGASSVYVDLKVYGKYNRLSLVFPRSIQKINEEFLNELVNGLFSVGYNWLSDAIAQAISLAILDTNKTLYRFVRVMMPNSEALDGFWFATLVDDKSEGTKKDIVLLDDIAVKRSILSAEKATRSLGRNASNIVTEMISEIVDQEDSVINAAIDKDRPFVIDLDSEKYYQKSSSFNLSLQGVWGKSVVCYPLMDSNNLRLVAFFKTEYKDDVVQFLDIHKEHLQALAQSNSEQIKSGLEIMKRIKRASDVEAWRLGEFLGGVMGGFGKSLSS